LPLPPARSARNRVPSVPSHQPGARGYGAGRPGLAEPPRHRHRSPAYALRRQHHRRGRGAASINRPGDVAGGGGRVGRAGQRSGPSCCSSRRLPSNSRCSWATPRQRSWEEMRPKALQKPPTKQRRPYLDGPCTPDFTNFSPTTIPSDQRHLYGPKTRSSFLAPPSSHSSPPHLCPFPVTLALAKAGLALVVRERRKWPQRNRFDPYGQVRRWGFGHELVGNKFGQHVRRVSQHLSFPRA